MKFLLFLPLLISSLFGSELVGFKTLVETERSEFLKKYQGKDVEIRGFLYEGEKTGYILAAEPDLKSCCLQPGSPQKQAIYVEGVGLKPLVGTKVLLRGLLYLNPDNPSSEVELLAALPAEDSDGDYVIFVICLLSLFLLFWIGINWFKKKMSDSHS